MFTCVFILILFLFPQAVFATGEPCEKPTSSEVIEMVVWEGWSMDPDATSPFEAFFIPLLEECQGSEAQLFLKLILKNDIESARKFFLAEKEIGLDPQAWIDTPVEWKSYRYTLLRTAVILERVEFVRLLLENGANPNDPSALHPPLVIAVKNGNLAIVKLLVESGAEVNGDDRYVTPLDHAMRHGHEKIVEFLEDRGGVMGWLGFALPSFYYH